MNLAITGATSGIGMETVKALAPQFQEIFLLVRNKEKAERLIAEWSENGCTSNFHIVYCDLMDLGTVAAAAEQIKTHTDHLDVLINNAGGVHGEREVTKDGLEASFSSNYLGHFLLTKKLIPLLVASGTSRIIHVSSMVHQIAKPDFGDLQSTRSYHAIKVYANVKLFTILFTRSLAEKYGKQGIHAFALHPGVINTNFGNGFKGFFKWGMKMIGPFLPNAKKGAKTSVFLATSPTALAHNGGYFKNSKLSTPSSLAQSRDIREQLWKTSEELLRSIGFDPDH